MEATETADTALTAETALGMLIPLTARPSWKNEIAEGEGSGVEGVIAASATIIPVNPNRAPPAIATFHREVPRNIEPRDLRPSSCGVCGSMDIVLLLNEGIKRGGCVRSSGGLFLVTYKYR